MNKAILLGGKFHRKEISVHPGQSIVRMALPPDIRVPLNRDIPAFEMIHPETEDYQRLYSVFREMNVFPDNVYLSTKIDPVEFLKNLVLDYLK